MMYTLFFSRLRDLSAAQLADYGRRSQQLDQHVSERFPGFVDQKTFVADDGERLTVVRFRDEEAQAAWKADPLHREAQSEGRSDFYKQYRIAVCTEVRCYEWDLATGREA